MLYTKCILCSHSPSDGARISVMSRHTHNDGITPDDRITLRTFDMHLRILAPSPKLIGDYYKRGLSWEDFERRYLEEIRTETKMLLIKVIAKKALQEDVTIMCIEETAEFCHRRLLAEECQRLEPDLQIKHL